MKKSFFLQKCLKHAKMTFMKPFSTKNVKNRFQKQNVHPEAGRCPSRGYAKFRPHFRDAFSSRPHHHFRRFGGADLLLFLLPIATGTPKTAEKGASGGGPKALFQGTWAALSQWSAQVGAVTWLKFP